MEWLGAHYDGEIKFASDYFEDMYEAAVKLSLIHIYNSLASCLSPAVGLPEAKTILTPCF